MAGRSKLGRFLKQRGSNQNEAAMLLGIDKSMFSLKANGFSDAEKEKLAEHYRMTDDEKREVLG